MSMQSTALLPELQKLPLSEDAQGLDFSDTVTRLRGMDKDHFAIEVSEIVETTLEGVFEARNVSRCAVGSSRISPSPIMTGL